MKKSNIIGKLNQLTQLELTKRVSAPPTILSPRPVLPLGISITHS